MTLTVTFAGDCTLGTDINYENERSFNSRWQAEEGDATYFLRNVADLFGSDDLTVVNMEGALTEGGERADKKFAFRGKPEYAKILSQRLGRGGDAGQQPLPGLRPDGLRRHHCRAGRRGGAKLRLRPHRVSGCEGREGGAHRVVLPRGQRREHQGDDRQHRRGPRRGRPARDRVRALGPGARVRHHRGAADRRARRY